MQTNVKAGDPITLLFGIAGTGPLELVQAPPLAELPALTADFKVPNEPLAGYVEEARKVFSTTIRPRKAGISEIPPIPFTYFDPEIGKFVTTASAADHDPRRAGRHTGARRRSGSQPGDVEHAGQSFGRRRRGGRSPADNFHRQ